MKQGDNGFKSVSQIFLSFTSIVNENLESLDL
jgi:hypothetical protein